MLAAIMVNKDDSDGAYGNRRGCGLMMMMTMVMTMNKPMMVIMPEAVMGIGCCNNGTGDAKNDADAWFN